MILLNRASLVAQTVKKSACNGGDLGLIPGLGRSLGEENGNPLQYSCLENPVAWGAWQATVCGVTKSWTQLSTWTHTHTELSVNLDCSSQWSRTAMLKYLCLQTGWWTPASSLSWYLVKCSKEQQTCTDSLSFFSIFSVRTTGSKAKVSKSCLVMSNSLWPHGLYPTRLLCPWNSPDKNTGVGCHSLLQQIFPT